MDLSLRLAIPKGRLEGAVLELLDDIGLDPGRNARSYRPSVTAPDIAVKMFKPQNIPDLVGLGSADAGFTGGDWVAESGADVTGGRVVKGTQFVGLRDAGNPVDLAARYYREGADEIFFLDITASVDGRDITLDVVRSGAEKVSVNTAAVKDPSLAASIFHFGEYTVGDVKEYLVSGGVPVRL